MSIYELIYKFGIVVRNHKIFKNYNFLVNSQYWEREALIDYQYHKLIDLISFSVKNSPYYKGREKEYSINKLNSITDISMLPVLTKEELLDKAQEIQVKDFPERLYYSETSGSTGRPLIFYRNQDWDAWHNASVFRGYSWHGVKPWDRNGYLWGYNLSIYQRLKTILLDLLQNRFRLFTYKEEEVEEFCKKLKRATYLNGYSSMIYEIAKHVNSRDNLKRDISLSFIKGTSEKIYDSYQEEAFKAFGRSIVSEYGSAESGIIAFECPKGRMHVNMETVIVEEIDKEIVVTNLVSKSFPIIRYKLGDYISLDKETFCECGKKSYIIKEITGRVGKMIYGRVNKYPSLTLYYIFKNLAINCGLVLNYQVVQKQKGELVFNIEQNIDVAQKHLLMNEVFKYFKDDIFVSFNIGTPLVSRTSKRKDFVSLL